MSPEILVSGTKTEAAWIAVTSHPLDGVDAQDVEAFGHDERRGVAEQHPPHVDLHHLTWRDEHTGDTLRTSETLILVSRSRLLLRSISSNVFLSPLYTIKDDENDWWV